MGYLSEECYTKCSTKLNSNEYALHNLLSLCVLFVDYALEIH